MDQTVAWRDLENEFRTRASIADDSFGIFYPASSQSPSTYLFGPSLFPILTGCLRIRDRQEYSPDKPPYWRDTFECRAPNKVAEEAFKSLARVAGRQLPGCPTGLDYSWQHWISLLHRNSPRSKKWVSPQAYPPAACIEPNDRMISATGDVATRIQHTLGTEGAARSPSNYDRYPGLTLDGIDAIFSREQVFCGIEPLFQASAELCLLLWSLDRDQIEELGHTSVFCASFAKQRHIDPNDSSSKTDNQRLVEAFRDHVLKSSAQKIAVDDIALVSGYKDETTFRLFRNRTEPVGLDARRAFLGTLRMEPDEFMKVLRKMVQELRGGGSRGRTKLEERALKRWCAI